MSGAWSEDEARARFDAAVDGELSSGERAAFEAALGASEALRTEFERHRAVVQATGELGRVSQVDLLAGVQQKLRVRSAGRFYRDRFAERSGRGLLPWLLALATIFVLIVALWFAYDAGFFARGAGTVPVPVPDGPVHVGSWRAWGGTGEVGMRRAGASRDCLRVSSYCSGCTRAVVRDVPPTSRLHRLDCAASCAWLGRTAIRCASRSREDLPHLQAARDHDAQRGPLRPALAAGAVSRRGAHDPRRWWRIVLPLAAAT